MIKYLTFSLPFVSALDTHVRMNDNFIFIKKCLYHMGFNETSQQFNIFIIPDTARAASCM